MNHRSIQIAFLTVVVLITQFNTLGDHIVLDDRIIIAGNAQFQRWDYIGEYFTKNFCEGVQWKCSYYRPVVALSYLVDYSLWGENFFGYHLTNLAIHLSVVLALYLTFERVFRKRILSFFSALFFAVHPVHTESVAWLSSRTDPPAGLFLLLSFGFYDAFLKRRKMGSLTDRPSGHPLIFFLGSLMFFILSLLTKEIGVIFPLLLLCYEWMVTEPDSSFRLPSAKRVWPYIVFLGVIGVYLAVRRAALGHLVLGEAMPETLWQKSAAVPVVVWHYFLLQIFPYPLYIFRPSPDYSGWFHQEVLFSSVFLLAVLWGLFRFRKKYQEVVFGGFWFLISMLPFLAIVAFSELRPDERYSYIPSMGISLMFGWLAHRLFSPGVALLRSGTRKGGQAVLIAMLVLFAVMTVMRNQDWRNEEMLWAGHYERVPDSPEGHANLGEIYLERGELERALEQYRVYTRFYPDRSLGYHFMGLIYQQMGKFDQALNQYRRALERGAPDKLTFYNMGLIYAERKAYDRAVRLFQLSLSIDPSYFWAHYALGDTFQNLGDWKGAVRHYEAALSLRPHRGDIHLRISKLYEKMGENEKAKKHEELFLQFSQNGKI